MQIDAQRLKTWRTDRGWTQQQLADICGLSLRTIQRVELQGCASMETSKALAAAFDCQLALLQNIVEPEPIATRAGAPRRVGWILVGFAAGVLCSVLVMAWLA